MHCCKSDPQMRSASLFWDTVCRGRYCCSDDLLAELIFQVRRHRVHNSRLQSAVLRRGSGVRTREGEQSRGEGRIHPLRNSTHATGYSGNISVPYSYFSYIPIYSYSTVRRMKAVMFYLRLSVCLSVCRLDYAKRHERIVMNFLDGWALHKE